MTKQTNADLLKNAGLSQRQFANALHITQQAVQLWVSGKRPLRTRYPQMAQILNCTTDTLFEAWKETIKLMGGKING